MAKKRYYQDKKDKMDESKGMKRYWASKDDVGAYHNPGNRSKYEDSMMIREDRSAPANLPQNVVHKDYPKGGYGLNGRLDDTIYGVDKQISDDARKMKSEYSPDKY